MDQRTNPAARVAPLPPEYSPELREQFESMKKNLGFVPNSILIMQRAPKLAKALAALTGAIWDPQSKVDIGFKRLIAHVSSRTTGCQYCMAHTAGGALHFGVDEAKLAAIWDYQTSPLFNDAERAALDFTVAASAVPNAVTDDMFVELRKYWSEDQIVEIVGCISVFGFLTTPSAPRSNASRSRSARNSSPSAAGRRASTPAKAGVHPYLTFSPRITLISASVTILATMIGQFSSKSP